ncbi:MAG TPA: hypothetical protein DCP90_01615 [Clostridiales bacterium]|nr:MAG: hypothetical protein A2Y22_01970 [Clostridiales bacterium GWD2_32_59]HAN09291.1 hypothetical protein [Clostridiales bacterium]
MYKILIIDNFSESIVLISKYLTSAGYTTFFANNITTAVQKTKVLNPDLIILDIVMPNISGYDICKILKEDNFTKYIPILIVTALDAEDIKIRALEVGADDFISRTFDKNTLISKVKSLVRVKKLSDELKNKYSEIEEKNVLINYQLKMAQKIQQALVKEFNLEFNDMKLYSKYMPALYIGGDVYDVTVLDENCLGVFIADVSGHGISAALLTSMLKLLFKNHVVRNRLPNEILSRMNHEFLSIFNNSIPNIYATAFYGIIDTKNNIITYSNAGHCPPMLIKGDNAEELAIDSFPLGIIPTPNYSYKIVDYNKGDLLLLYTDGLSDSIYKDNNHEFINILKDILLDIKPESLSRITNILLNQFCNATDHKKQESDDVSLILLRM